MSKNKTYKEKGLAEVASKSALDRLMEEDKEKKARKRKRLLYSLLVLTLLLIPVSIFFMKADSGESSTANTDSEVKSSQATSPTLDSSPKELSERSVTGGSVSEDAEGAAKALASYLDSVRYASDPENKEVDLYSEMKKLEEGDSSMIPESLKEAIYVPSDSSSPDRVQNLRNSSYQALLSIANRGLSEASAKYSEAELDTSKILVNSEAGTVYIPLDSYEGAVSGAFIFEMTYLDGQWKISPLMTVQQTYFLSTLSG